MKKAVPNSIDQPGSFESPEQEVFLRLLKTADVLEGELSQLLKESELSATQYNVLRILRGAGDTGMPCGRITERMITREPDMTRLLDRLEARGLISRQRSPDDRRVVLGRLTGKGKALLKSLDQPVLQLHAGQLSHLGKGRLRELAGLLAAARART
jgi:DNA-binding MarR family transcriptional regulator